jgi:hypothetical protein
MKASLHGTSNIKLGGGVRMWALDTLKTLKC